MLTVKNENKLLTVKWELLSLFSFLSADWFKDPAPRFQIIHVSWVRCILIFLGNKRHNKNDWSEMKRLKTLSS